jgi:uncharacterized protein
MTPALDAAPPVAVVIDTQTLLDWQLFRNPVCAAWTLPGPTWRWLATATMRDELGFVLNRAWSERWAAPAEVLAFFDAHASLLPAPPTSRLRCTDPDDQVFIDLALAHAPALLLTRDRALLRLAKRAAPAGVMVLPPSRWSPP